MNCEWGFLSDYFDAVSYKKLTAVEIDPRSSNEHEFNGISSIRSMLGDAKQILPTRIVYLSDDENDITEDHIELTWYDAREKHPTRTEYRLYYQSSVCITLAEAGDLMVLCKNHDEMSMSLFIAKEGNTIEKQLAWLFAISLDSASNSMKPAKTDNQRMNYFTNIILDKIGFVVDINDSSLLDRLLERFPEEKLPSTNIFSNFARTFEQTALEDSNADVALVTWLSWEERLFKIFERHIVDKKLDCGFNDVDDFLSYSLSIQNRRKSRAGFALENHLTYIFDRENINFSYNKITENKSKPDFIFPGINEYHDPNFPPGLLTMLGVKTTCKDRWRQVLSEAERIPSKHLLTLEPSISINQTNEMIDKNLRLVVPDQIIPTFSPEQQEWITNLSTFIQYVRDLERHNIGLFR